MGNIGNAFSYSMTNAGTFSGAFFESVSVLLVNMLGILSGIIILVLVLCIIYLRKPKPFLE